MSKIRILAILVGFTFLHFFPLSTASAADNCADRYFISKTFSNGAKWDMCWSHSKNQGIIYHHIYYQPKDEARRMVLAEASIAQIHVPYDDNGNRFHDVSDFGLGDDGSSNNNLVSLSAAECPNGSLAYYNNKAAVCSRTIADGGASFRSGSSHRSAEQLKVFSMSKVGQYIYGIDWDFHDDGRITPSIVATGALQRLASNGDEQHGWLIDSAGRVGLSHMHNFFWRLDFDIDGSATNDIVQEINFDPYQGQRYKKISTLTTERGRSVDPALMRSWLIKDGNTTNRKGHKISYEIRLNEAGQREVGPAHEPFTAHDFYVTKASNCELFASNNAAVNNCATNNLSEFANGEQIVNQDIVAWVAVSFYHMPRAEDAPQMDAHVSGFELIPRDWHTTNPTLDNAPPVSLRLSANEDFITSPSATILIDVMANDTGHSIYIDTVNNPRNGTALIIDNKIQYTPDPGYLGEDVFWYNIKDSSGAEYGTKINVTVTKAVVNSGNGSGGGAISWLQILLLSLFTLYTVLRTKKIHW